MKRILTIVATLAISAISFAQNASGVREDITSVSSDDKVYELFTYKDADGMFGYYLALGAPDAGQSLTSIYLGTDPTEAQRTLDAIVALFESPSGVSQEFTARIITGRTLSGLKTSQAEVQTMMMGGKRLSFIYGDASSKTETYMRKNAAKAVSSGFKQSMKP